ncbi:MAG: LCP family protein [Acutalibacteraceae bacterium]|nr:LCP family protein [Acutalibacteraceae bacterium]
MIRSPNKKVMSKGKKIALWIVCSFTAVILAVAVTAVSLWYSGRSSMTDNDVIINNGNATQSTDENSVEYQGKKYKYNDNMTTVLCMGIDNEKEQSGGAYITGQAGQADAIYLIAIDTSTGKSTVIGIPRDIMTDIDIYTKSGSLAGTQTKQLCLAFAYGDGKDESAKNTAKSVSRLLYGMPVNTYFAVDDKSIAPLHNAVGPITVIPNEDINYPFISFKKGVEYKLTGSNVFEYLRTRNSDTADASVLRLERQIDYLKKYSAAVIKKTSGDFLFPVKLYNKTVKNAVTNLDVGRVTYLATSVFKNRSDVSLEFKKIKGSQIVGESGFAEFYADEDELLKLVMETFYTEIEA